MLQNPNLVLKIGDYAVLKLINGDEVLGKVNSIDNTGIVLSKPRSLMMHPQKGEIMMIPFMHLCNDGEFRFQYTALITTGTMIKQVESDYIQTTTGIKLATGGFSL